MRHDKPSTIGHPPTYLLEHKKGNEDHQEQNFNDINFFNASSVLVSEFCSMEQEDSFVRLY